MLYKLRWRIELFFRWMKGHLRIKHYYGTSPNAVKTQIWIAVCTYLMIAILHKQLKLPGNLHRTLQVLSIHHFDKVTLSSRAKCNVRISRGTPDRAFGIQDVCVVGS